MSKNMRQKIRRDWKIAQERGCELILVDRPESFEPNFRILVDLHQERWRSTGQPGVFASAKFTSFHRMLAAKVFGKGWIVMYVLRVAGEPVAAIYDFNHKGKYYYYQAGFRRQDTADRPDRAISPGTLLLALSIQNAIQSGIREYDFQKVQPGSYKMRWHGRMRGILQVRLTRNGPKERVYALAKCAAGGMRQARRGLRDFVRRGRSDGSA